MAKAVEVKALMALGRAVAADISAGEPSEATRQACTLMAAAPHMIPRLLDLAVAESRKSRPDDALTEAYMTLLGSTLDVLRLDMESGQAKASAIVASLRMKLIGLVEDGTVDSSLLLRVARQFAMAKLDLGETMKALFGDMIGDRDPEAGSDGDPLKGLETHFSMLAEEVDGDPFALAGELMDSAAVMPDLHKIGMARAMAFSNAVPARDAAMGWLFDASSEVRAGAAAVLAEAGKAGKLTAETARRLVVVRNWLPQAERSALDAAIEASRRAGAVATPRADPAIMSVHLTGVDGGGAQSSFVLMKVGRTFAIVALLFKLGLGVRDAWVRRGLTKAESREFLEEVGEALELYQGSLDFIRNALPGFLWQGLQAGAMPPFGLLDAVETLGLDIVNPAAFDLDEMMRDLAKRLAIDDTTDRRAVIEDSDRWPLAGHEVMASWYETGAEVAAVLEDRRLSRGKPVGLVLSKILPDRAHHWAEHLAWLARIYLDTGHETEARQVTCVALELIAGRPVADIPLMRTIAETTVAAWKADR